MQVTELNRLMASDPILVRCEADTESEVNAFIESYLRNYHPAGYSTYVRERGLDAVGKYYALIFRYPSCD